MEEEKSFGSSPAFQEPQFNSPEPKTEYVSPQERQKRKFPKKFLYLLAAVLIILLIFNAIKVLTSPKQTSTIITVTPTPISSSIEEATPAPEEATPTPEPSATVAPSADPIDKATGLDRSELSISVQNGSGVLGAAKKAADYLKGLGYAISGTANADNNDYTNVTIQVKADSKYLDLLKKDLGLQYTVGSATSDLSASSSADAVVIIGK